MRYADTRPRPALPEPIGIAVLQHAFREWAVICEALGRGEQSLLLCKGDFGDDEAELPVDRKQFWLYPTFPPQQHDGINDQARPILNQIEAERPPAGIVRLQYWAEVETIYRIREELPALLLSHLHFWSTETIRQWFNDKTPGLYLLVVRVSRAPMVREIAALTDTGHRWVELEKPLPTENSTPVLDDNGFRIVRRQLELLLSPTAFA